MPGSRQPTMALAVTTRRAARQAGAAQDLVDTPAHSSTTQSAIQPALDDVLSSLTEKASALERKLATYAGSGANLDPESSVSSHPKATPAPFKDADHSATATNANDEPSEQVQDASATTNGQLSETPKKVRKIKVINRNKPGHQQQSSADVDSHTTEHHQEQPSPTGSPKASKIPTRTRKSAAPKKTEDKLPRKSAAPKKTEYKLPKMDTETTTQSSQKPSPGLSGNGIASRPLAKLKKPVAPKQKVDPPGTGVNNPTIANLQSAVISESSDKSGAGSNGNDTAAQPSVKKKKPVAPKKRKDDLPKQDAKNSTVADPPSGNTARSSLTSASGLNGEHAAQSPLKMKKASVSRKKKEPLPKMGAEQAANATQALQNFASALKDNNIAITGQSTQSTDAASGTAVTSMKVIWTYTVKAPASHPRGKPTKTTRKKHHEENKGAADTASTKRRRNQQAKAADQVITEQDEPQRPVQSIEEDAPAPKRRRFLAKTTLNDDLAFGETSFSPPSSPPIPEAAPKKEQKKRQKKSPQPTDGIKSTREPGKAAQKKGKAASQAPPQPTSEDRDQPAVQVTQETGLKINRRLPSKTSRKTTEPPAETTVEEPDDSRSRITNPKDDDESSTASQPNTYRPSAVPETAESESPPSIKTGTRRAVVTFEPLLSQTKRLNAYFRAQLRVVSSLSPQGVNQDKAALKEAKNGEWPTAPDTVPRMMDRDDTRVPGGVFEGLYAKSWEESSFKNVDPLTINHSSFGTFTRMPLPGEPPLEFPFAGQVQPGYAEPMVDNESRFDNPILIESVEESPSPDQARLSRTRSKRPAQKSDQGPARNALAGALVRGSSTTIVGDEKQALTVYDSAEPWDDDNEVWSGCDCATCEFIEKNAAGLKEAGDAGQLFFAYGADMAPSKALENYHAHSVGISTLKDYRFLICGNPKQGHTPAQDAELAAGHATITAEPGCEVLGMLYGTPGEEYVAQYVEDKKLKDCDEVKTVKVDVMVHKSKAHPEQAILERKLKCLFQVEARVVLASGEKYHLPRESAPELDPPLKVRGVSPTDGKKGKNGRPKRMTNRAIELQQAAVNQAYDLARAKAASLPAAWPTIAYQSEMNNAIATAVLVHNLPWDYQKSVLRKWIPWPKDALYLDEVQDQATTKGAQSDSRKKRKMS